MAEASMKERRRIHAKFSDGQTLYDKYGEMRIMAMHATYAMVRRKGCTPFVVDLKSMRVCHGGQQSVFTSPLPSEDGEKG